MVTGAGVGRVSERELGGWVLVPSLLLCHHQQLTHAHQSDLWHNKKEVQTSSAFFRLVTNQALIEHDWETVGTDVFKHSTNYGLSLKLGRKYKKLAEFIIKLKEI